MIEKFPLRDEPGKSLIIFLKNGKYYGHVIKDKVGSTLAKFIYETKRYDQLELLKEDYPSSDEAN